VNDKIMELLWQRSEVALKEISIHYGNLLHSIAYHVLPSNDDVEECVNDTLLDIWNSVPPKEPESISSYACMIVRRKAIDRVRFYTAKKRGGTEYEISLAEMDECILNVNVIQSENSDLSDVINEFLGELSAEHRHIFMSRYYGFQSVEEIANKHSISKNAVNVRLTRMRKKLRIYLTERSIFV